MSRSHRSLLAPLAVTAFLGLAGCSGTPGTQTSVQPVPQVAQTQASSPAQVSGSDGEAAKAYFEALITNDPDSMAEALKYAAPNSLAESYAHHLINADQARLDGGSSDDPDTLDCDGTDGSYGYYDDKQDCSLWQNVRFNNGKVVDFTVKKIDISKRLTMGSGDKTKAGKLADITFLSAYQSVQSKSLYVVVQIKSHGQKVDLDDLYSAKYRDPSGRQGEATDFDGPTNLDKDSTANASMIFKNAKPGGVVTLDVYEPDTYSESMRTVKIKTA